MSVIRRLESTLRLGVIAGAAGGLAEIAWVSLYATMTGASAASVAHGVTTAVGATALLANDAVMLGIVVHMAIAVALGTALAVAWQALAPYWPGIRPRYALVLAALTAVWAMNFFIVLPVLSPDFVQLVPYAVSFASKLLFGIAAAEVLRRGAVEPARAYLRARA